jgi:hypothetical protein
MESTDQGAAISDNSDSEEDQISVPVASESRKAQNAQFEALLVFQTHYYLKVALIY